ncbi:MAG: TonB-dependent receptor [Weeksellaceae bacterium]|nr:TonB-dependent receptor [Weeksellaceae bacterium]
MLRVVAVIFVLLLSDLLMGQEDTIQLEAVEFLALSRTGGDQLKAYSVKDSAWQHQTQHFFDLLQYNTSAAMRSNGLGMVSSISMRGGTAQQTSFLWNGIPINSKLLGQSDPNILAIPEFAEVNIVPGGNSLLHGSGAIGGVVEINNQNVIDTESRAHIKLRAASFETVQAGSGFTLSKPNSGLQFFVNAGSARNNFTVPAAQYVNQNGETYFLMAGGQAAHRFNAKTTLSAHFQWSEEERNFILSSAGATPTARHSNQLLTLLRLQHRTTIFQHQWDLSYSRESYEYFNPAGENALPQNGDHVNSYLARYDVQLNLGRSLDLKLLSQLSKDFAEGFNTGISDVNLGNGHAALQADYRIINSILSQSAIRKEFSNGYASPLLFLQRFRWTPYNTYQLQLGFSSNFRAPTINDMFWQPGGNPNLSPEYALQWELDQKLSIAQADLKLSIYYNSIENMIRWLPTQGDIWTPVNTHRVVSKGLEASLERRFWKNKIQILTMYAFTDARNQETGNLLTYTPQHKLNVNLALQHNKWRFGVQNMYLSKQYTHTDSNPDTAINAYGLTNLNLGYVFSQKPLKRLTFGINNLFNTQYQMMPYRPMPGINFTSQLIFEI